MLQLILHLIGDYVTQSDWMAQNKTKRFWPAFLHAVIYSLPFLLIGSREAVCIIYATHILIDRYRLARFAVYAKNILLGLWIKRIPWYFMFWKSEEQYSEYFYEYVKDEDKWSWENCSETGYPKDSPAWLSVWLLIAADNTIHLLINWMALKFL